MPLVNKPKDDPEEAHQEAVISGVLLADDGLPVVQAEVTPLYRPRTRRLVALQVQTVCPFCGQTHLHTLQRSELPRAGEYLGQVAAACDPGRGYHLLVKMPSVD